MAELTEFDIKLCETIQNSGSTKGAGSTFAEMLESLGLESTDANIEKVSESLRKLQKAQYVYKIAITENIAPEYFTTQKYWQEREDTWMGPKFGKKILRAKGVSDTNPRMDY